MCDMRRDAYAERFGLTYYQGWHLNDEIVCQLFYCRSDEARRILLGISE